MCLCVCVCVCVCVFDVCGWMWEAALCSFESDLEAFFVLHYFLFMFLFCSFKCWICRVPMVFMRFE